MLSLSTMLPWISLFLQHRNSQRRCEEFEFNTKRMIASRTDSRGCRMGIQNSDSETPPVQNIKFWTRRLQFVIQVLNHTTSIANERSYLLLFALRLGKNTSLGLYHHYRMDCTSRHPHQAIQPRSLHRECCFSSWCFICGDNQCDSLVSVDDNQYESLSFLHLHQCDWLISSHHDLRCELDVAERDARKKHGQQRLHLISVDIISHRLGEPARIVDESTQVQLTTKGRTPEKVASLHSIY